MLTIRQRIDTLGVSEPTITKQGDNRIRVSIPSVSDQEEALDLIGKQRSWNLWVFGRNRHSDW